MKNRLGLKVLAAGCILVLSLPLTALAGKGGGQGKGRGFSQSQGRVEQGAVRQERKQLRLRDGSCINQAGPQAGSRERKGNTYGPGDGTGYGGVGPKDGTGYGAPPQR